VIKNANKISIMIDRLSLAVKIENENLTLQKSEFEIKPLLNYVKDTLLQKYRDREIVIDADDIKIKADKTMMENLLINLTENALKYSEDEVIIRVRDEKLEVIDQGIGIKEENLKKITDRFFRVDTLKWDNSIGVGLYIVKYILKLHKTQLKIDSEYGKGSSFWFSLKEMKI
jgi:signal transduction histidine kinase